VKKKITICSIIIIFIIIVGIFIISHYSNYDKVLVDANTIITDSEFENITYNEIGDILNTDVLGILTIEKIGLSATVKEGSSSKVLREYVGHIESTSSYDGNIGLAGHNRGNKYSYFARINELEAGDIITYKTRFYTRNYKVNNIQVIYENDWSLLQETEENKISLVTCIANKRNQRLVVQATEEKE